MVVLLFTVALGACPAVPPASVRVMDCRLAAGLVDGLRRSSTLHALVTRVGELRGLVYVTTAMEIRARNNHRLHGCTWDIVSAAGPRRLVRVETERRYDDYGVAVLAHELQHVVELLESNGAPVGDPISTGIRETRGAQATQRAVARELRTTRR